MSLKKKTTGSANRQRTDYTCGLSSWGRRIQLFSDAVFHTYLIDPLLAAITTHHIVNPHLSAVAVCPVVGVGVCLACLCVHLWAFVARRGQYIRFGRGSTISLTCWGSRLKRETQNVFCITLSSHSCSNWFLFKKVHISAPGWLIAEREVWRTAIIGP